MTAKEMVNAIHEKGVSFKLMSVYVTEESKKLKMKKGISSTMLRKISINEEIWTRYEKAIEGAYKRLCK